MPLAPPLPPPLLPLLLLLLLVVSISCICSTFTPAGATVAVKVFARPTASAVVGSASSPWRMGLGDLGREAQLMAALRHPNGGCGGGGGVCVGGGGGGGGARTRGEAHLGVTPRHPSRWSWPRLAEARGRWGRTVPAGKALDSRLRPVYHQAATAAPLPSAACRSLPLPGSLPGPALPGHGVLQPQEPGRPAGCRAGLPAGAQQQQQQQQQQRGRVFSGVAWQRVQQGA